MSQIIETEETLIIETPERVQLAFALASIGNRFLAVIIDHFIQYASAIILWIGFVNLTAFGGEIAEGGVVSAFEDTPNWMLAILIIVFFLIFSGYFILFEWLWNGQTPGKRFLKLRVIREDGRPITLWESVARNLLRIFDSFPGIGFPIYSVGLIAIFANSRDQRVGDMFAGTVVVRERVDEAPTFAETFTESLGDAAFKRVQKPVPFEADVRVLTEPEIDVVENFLRRRWDLSEKQRLWMAWRVALPIMYKLKPKYDSEKFTYEGFLEELLSRFHTRRIF